MQLELKPKPLGNMSKRDIAGTSPARKRRQMADKLLLQAQGNKDGQSGTIGYKDGKNRYGISGSKSAGGLNLSEAFINHQLNKQLAIQASLKPETGPYGEQMARINITKAF